MRHLLALLFLLAGCPKSSPKAPQLNPTEAALLSWVSSKLDMRTWNGCTRGSDLAADQLEVVLQVDAEGVVSEPTFEPAPALADPALLCLGMVLLHPPEVVAPETPGPIRISVSRILAASL